jgi:hypothetical protein
METLDAGEVRELVQRLAQSDPKNFRTGTTSLFPTKAELNQLLLFENCDVKFAKTYQLQKVLAEGGLSGSIIVSAKSVDERQRRERLLTDLATMPLAVKKIPLTGDKETDDANLQDVVIGSRLNFLIEGNLAPGFMRTVDWFVCHDAIGPDNPDFVAFLYVVAGRQDMEIPVFLSKVSLPTTDMMMSVLAQLLFNLESAQKTLRYTHYDLHASNVMVTSTKRTALRRAIFWEYKRVNGESLWILAEDVQYNEVVIIDFGQNYMQTPVRLFSEFGERLAPPKVVRAGIRPVFHKQWDMRRFVFNLVDQVMYETTPRSPKVAPSWWQWKKQPPQRDFFQKLQLSSVRDYEELMDVLDAMAGSQHVRLPGDEKTETHRDLENSYNAMRESSRSAWALEHLTRENVLEILTKFKERGMRWLIQRLRDGDELTSLVLLYMWQWTRFVFPTTVGEVLDMPFFDELRQRPKDGDSVAMAGEFQHIELPRRGTLASPIVGCFECSEPATDMCPCNQAIYCSDSCADADWEEHQHHCTSTE